MNINLVKQRLQELEAQKKGGSKNTWTPQVGEHLVRIIPYIHNKEYPFLELFFYYNLKKGTVISPLSFNRPDPVQEFVDKLKSTGDQEDWKTGFNMQAKYRVYVPVLIRGKEEEGVKFWGFGKQIYSELLKIMADPDYGDITDLKTGRDITIDVTKEGGKKWSDITIRPKPNKTVATDKREVLELIKEMPKVEDIWKEPTYQELKDMLENFLNNVSDEPAAETVTGGTIDDDPFTSPNTNYDDVPEFAQGGSSKKNQPVKAASTPDDFDELFK